MCISLVALIIFKLLYFDSTKSIYQHVQYEVFAAFPVFQVMATEILHHVFHINYRLSTFYTVIQKHILMFCTTFMYTKIYSNHKLI